MSGDFESPRKGMKVEGYLLLRPIDGGGFADVWEAEDQELKRRVAFKVIRSVRSREQAVQKRFERERVVHGNLVHDNIVKVFDAGKSLLIGLWMSMELMEGTLDRLLEEGPLDPTRTIELLAPIADALDYAHEQDSVHRDVKPSNILLDGRARPYLSDFGLAKTRDASRMTETGALVGTRGYAAPEQATDEEVTGAADVYSLAVVLFECLTNSKPNPVAKPDGTIDWSEVPEASKRNPDLPPEIDAVIVKGMSDRPGDRQQTVTELIDGAREALKAPSRTNREAARRSRRRQAVVFSAIAALLLTLGIGAGAVAHDDPASERSRTVRVGNASLKIPEDWLVRGGDSLIPDLGLRHPKSLRPSDDSNGLAGLTVVAGVSAGVGSGLLPVAYRSQPGANRKSRVPLRLGSLRGYRYANLTDPVSGDRMVVFSAPTHRGVVFLACRRSAAGVAKEQLDICNRIAGTLDLRRGDPYPIGPSPAFSRALRKRIGRLEEHRDKARAEMAGAIDGGDQATAAEDLSAAFRKAASGLAGVVVSQESAPGKKQVVEALKAGEAAFQGLAQAARSENRARYSRGAGLVDEAEATLAASLRKLKRLGYALGPANGSKA